MSWFTKLFGNPVDPIERDTAITVDTMPDGTASYDDVGSQNIVDFNIIRHDIANLPQTEADAIARYRSIALSAEVSEAVQEIINETFNVDGAEMAMTIQFYENSKLTASLQDKIKEAFHYVYHDLFDFDGTGKNLFRSWYVDSRLFLHKVVSEDKTKIIKLQQIDPLNIRRLRGTKVTNEGFVDLGKEEIKYVYVPNSQKPQLWGKDFQTLTSLQWQKERKAAIFQEEAIAYSDSGLVSDDGNYIIGHLHKAIVPYNNMKMMESAMVIYRVVRAPERRVFYIDIADLPRSRAEKYMQDLINKFKNKMVYDTKTGDTIDKRNINSMLEDIWLPRRSNGRSTEVSTLPGGQNTGVIEDVEYCRDVFYRSLNIPRSRFQAEQSVFSTGRITEITRDEYRFQKFIQALRARFILVVEDVLKTELVLRKVISMEDWPGIKRDIQWIYAEDNNFVEMKKTEILEARIGTLNSVSSMIGEMFSQRWALSNIMHMTDDEIETLLGEVADEKGSGINNQDEPVFYGDHDEAT